MIKVALGLPTCGPPTWGLLDSIWGLTAHQEGVHFLNIRPPRSLPIALSRQFISMEFMRSDFDYLWWIDQDCFFVPETLDRLLSWDAPIVGALCVIRGGTGAIPMVFRGKGDGDTYRVLAPEAYQFVGKYYDHLSNKPQILDVPPPDSLQEIDFTGCHCLLTKREVYENTPQPWFDDIPGREDRYFMLQAKEHGYKSYVDFSVFAGHGSGAERSAAAYDFLSSYFYQSKVMEAAENERRKRAQV